MTTAKARQSETKFGRTFHKCEQQLTLARQEEVARDLLAGGKAHDELTTKVLRWQRFTSELLEKSHSKLMLFLFSILLLERLVEAFLLLKLLQRVDFERFLIPGIGILLLA